MVYNGKSRGIDKRNVIQISSLSVLYGIINSVDYKKEDEDGWQKYPLNIV